MHSIEQFHVLQIRSLHPLMQIGDVLENHGKNGEDAKLSKGNAQLARDN